MTPSSLVVLIGGLVAGRVTRDRRHRFRFTYEEEWRRWPNAVPLSLSMPLGAAEHGHAAVEAFLWGLLPDNETVLDRWARRFHVSARNPFGLIANVGEDCAGAVQFARPERLDDLLGPDASQVEWLDDAGVAARLRALRADHAAWRRPDDPGQFSLAGAQPKTALLFMDGRWGVPSGRMPTTHILKPPLPGLDGHPENEHLCLSLARALGLPAAGTEVRRFEDEVAIVVERYDRARTASLAAAAAAESAMWAARAVVEPEGAARAAAAAARAAALGQLAERQPILRLHQEDLCQALGLRPTAKYQNEGGPGPGRIADLLRTYSSNPDEDVSTFIDALAFNWLIGGADGHAKNYSLLHGGGGRVRLAPFYDLASALPYDDMDPERLTLAMKVGDKYRLRHIRRSDWEHLARDVRLQPAGVVERVADLAAKLPGKVDEIRERAARDALAHPLVDRLARALAERARACAELLRS